MKNGAGERPIGAGSGQEKIWRAPKSCSTNERTGFPSADQSEASLRPHRQPLSVPPHPSFLNSWCAPPLMITITFILSTFFLPTHHKPPPPHSTQPWPLYGFLSIKTNFTPNWWYQNHPTFWFKNMVLFWLCQKCRLCRRLLHDLDNQRLTRKAGLYLCSVSPAIDQVLTSVQVSGSDQFHSALLKFGWTLDTF